jgi:enoyl-CoA hydratase/carnithine racemase
MANDTRTVTAVVMEGIALLTVNLPRQNAADVATWDGLAAAIGEYAEDPAIRVLVLTGAGHFAFVTDPMAAALEDQTIHDAAAQRALQALAAFPKPSIARIRGDCIGAGLLLALHADIIVAAEDSAFALPGSRWGAAYPPASVAALVSLIGPQQAKRLLYSGGRIEAREALRIGLVALVCDDADLSDTVVDLAREIADNAPIAVRAGKRMVDAPGDASLAALVDECRSSEDYVTGVTALRAGRVPIFNDR